MRAELHGFGHVHTPFVIDAWYSRFQATDMALLRREVAWGRFSSDSVAWGSLLKRQPGKGTFDLPTGRA